MALKIGDDEIVFSSGRTIYTHRGIIGLSPDGDLFQGYDGKFYPDDVHADDARELADHMIERWQKFKAGL